MTNDKPVRIQKLIADSGMASRRQAEKWIEEGRVTINGNVAVLGDRCVPGDELLEVDGKKLPRKMPPKVVIAMNKPKNYLCTNSDPHDGRTVFELLTPELQRLRLFCVGRLDKESEGLLLLTNDGELQQQLAHPSFQVAKIYHVIIDRHLAESDIAKLRKGIRWEGEHLAIDKVFPARTRNGEDWSRLEVTLHHGKKREIRRLFYAFDYEVKKLKRVQIGAFRLKGIPRGKFKILSNHEIGLFFRKDTP